MNYIKKGLTLILILSYQFSFSQYIQGEGSKKFDALLQYIDYAYVDSTDENELVENAIVSVLKETPSQWFSSKRFRCACVKSTREE